MKIGHKMILASAGSGKTYALTNRFVKLLVRRAKPERIVALTFTRKAAGEFFDEILNKLARAAQDATAARKLADDIGESQVGPTDFRRMLRDVCEVMHRLNLGTLDSFFSRIVRNFPLELGLSGDFAILDLYAAHRERRRVLQRMFLGTGAGEGARREFMEAFKRATFGTEEKRLGGRLDEFLDANQEIHWAAPTARLWGSAERIWPDGSEWLKGAAQRGVAVEALRAELPWADLNEKQRVRWENFLAGVANWSPGAELPGAVEYLFRNALKAWPGLEEVMVERKKMAMPSRARAELRRVLVAMIGGELARRLEMTQGLHAVLHGYETVYHEQVRRAGQLTFADVQRLLAPEAGARLLSGVEGEGRLFLDFRLDARYDHWLLDEFQDTSFGQWSVLKNLIDEVMQDDERARSFFYVGDVKQAIFAWREGDPRLFREIYNYYNAGSAKLIEEDHLVKSYRSGRAVIAAVNRVFGDKQTIAELFPARAAAAWSDEWRAHESAKNDLSGQVALLHADDENNRFARTLEVLREIRPVERGLTCAILTQKNDTAARMADFLRREGGLPALAEADLAIATDNPLTASLMALIQSAAHPGDSLAWEHVQMTPLGAALMAEGLESRDAVSHRVLEQIHAEGFERMAEFWLRRLERSLADGDDFSRERGAQFAAAARLFDETGRRNAAEFLRFMEAFTEREAETARVIRVMTIHKSKGLGFDLVVLPDLEGQSFDQRRDGLAVSKASNRMVEWVLDLPPKLFYEADEVLAAHVRQEEATACYEKFSLLYVAMTRAKRAMYLITEPVGKSVSRNAPQWLARSLGEDSIEISLGGIRLPGAWATGDADWFQRLPIASAREQARMDLGRINAAIPGRRARRATQRPSVHRAGLFPAVQLFATEAADAAEFGREVHQLFSQIEWWEDHAADAWIHERTEEGWSVPAVREVASCLIRAGGVFARSDRRTEVWREKPYEMILDDAWVTGVFDRVVVVRDERGLVQSATLIDFKTDRIDLAGLERAVARHLPQLKTYRAAVAILLGCQPAAVTCLFVFTAHCKTVDVSSLI